MREESKREAVAETMRQINQVWLDRQVEPLAPMLHSDIVMAAPGFAGRIQGRDEFLAGFRDFCQNATVH
jgi:hypothetical protein